MTDSSRSLAQPSNPLPEITIDELPQLLRESCARAGWDSLMDVQQRAIPYLLDRRDLMIQSKTGSGKTGAFLLPIMERINPNHRTCQSLILVPTRELAQQVTREAEMLSEGSGIAVASVYGGVKYGPQLRALERGSQIVVGTPGRVLDHLLRGSLSLNDIEVLVFDEADRMLSMGFYPDMKEVQRYLPEKNRYNAYLFSATFPAHVLRLAQQFLTDPELLSLSRDQVHVAEVEHVFCLVPGMDKDRTLVRLLEIDNPPNAVIFCNTKATVSFVTVVLQRFGFDADELSADLSQSKREHVLQRIKAGSLRYLVATDLAGRGIDIPELSHVIQYEVPEDPEQYIHRSGRTGRAGLSGQAITLVNGREIMDLQRIAKRYSIPLIERSAPTESDVAAVVSQRLTVQLEARLRQYDRVQRERIERFVPLAQSLGQNEDEAALVAMLLEDAYLGNLQRHDTPSESEFSPDEPETDTDIGGANDGRGSGRRRRRRGGRTGSTRRSR